MRRGTATAWWLLVAATALLVLVLPVLTSARRLPRPPPVLPLGGGGDAGPREGIALAAVGGARRLGQRAPVNKPPSPNPHGMTSMAMPPPPSIY